jgi:hypothetical protein
MSMKAYDHYDREIRRNDVVTYPVRKGSSMWLDNGKVTAINSDGSLSITKPDTGRKTVIQNTDTTILATRSVRQAVNEQLRELAA